MCISRDLSCHKRIAFTIKKLTQNINNDITRINKIVNLTISINGVKQ
jgi:hypothetical protein